MKLFLFILLVNSSLLIAQEKQDREGKTKEDLKKFVEEQVIYTKKPILPVLKWGQNFYDSSNAQYH